MKQVNLGKDVWAGDLFLAMEQSQVMVQKGYKILYADRYTAERDDGGDEYGLCYSLANRTYIHIIMSAGIIASFEYFTTLDTEHAADGDINDLLTELRQKFPTN